jgi:putative ABC transport system permease protein
MFTNYLLVAVRNLRRYWSYTLINVTGLAIALTCALQISTYVRHELGYNDHLDPTGRLYRVMHKLAEGSNEPFWTGRMGGNVPRLLDEGIPGIDQAFKTMTRNVWIRHEDQSRQTRACIADNAYTDYFSITAVDGDAREILSRPSSAMVTRSFARRLLGDVDPIGQTVSIDYKWGLKGEWVIQGLIEEYPDATEDILAPDFVTISRPATMEDQHPWYWTWVVLENGIDPADVEVRMKSILPRLGDPENVSRSDLRLQPLRRIHLHTTSDFGIRPGPNSGSGDISQLYLFLSAGVLLLLIVAANFVNLTTAHASARGRELGVRKAIGATRFQLASQFLTESLLITFVAAVVALVAARLLHGFLTTYLDIDLPVANGWTAILDVAAIALLQAIFACTYPAMYLSALRPVAALSSAESKGSGRIGRKGLVVVQFAISAVLLMSTLAILQQMRLVRDKDLGFDKELLVKLPLFWANSSLRERAEEIRQTFRQLPGVIDATASHTVIGGWNKREWRTVRRMDRQDAYLPMDFIAVDARFISTYGLELIEGLGIREGSRDPVCILNEKAAQSLGYYPQRGEKRGPESPVGVFLDHEGYEPREVVGVVRDFQHGSLHRTIAPLVLINRSRYYFLTLRIAPGNVAQTLVQLERGWKQFLPDKPFVYEFVDEYYSGFYARETAVAKSLTLTAGLAIFTACLGMLGLAAFLVRKRIKEVGVRRVLGASESGIFVLLSSDFLRLVVFANLLAVPVAWHGLNQWLNGFAYRIALGPSIFVLGTMAGLLFALAAVTWQARSAARMNPVDALRTQ